VRTPAPPRQLPGSLKTKGGRSGSLGGDWSELSKAFFLAVIEALLKAAKNLDHFQVIKERNGVLGKASAEEALLSSLQSRGPPERVSRNFKQL